MWYYVYLPRAIPRDELGPAQAPLPDGLEDVLGGLALPRAHAERERVTMPRPSGAASGTVPDIIRQIGNIVGDILNRGIRLLGVQASGPAAPFVAPYIPQPFRPTPAPRPAEPARGEPDVAQPDFTGGGGTFIRTSPTTATGTVQTIRGERTVEVELPIAEGGFGGAPADVAQPDFDGSDSFDMGGGSTAL